MKLTAVEFLADKFNYITWLRNRDEISAGKADEMRAKFFKQAMEMEKEQIELAHYSGSVIRISSPDDDMLTLAEQYYNETYDK
jgi:hypothetical protein